MRNLCLALVLVGSVAACKSYDPQRVEKDFGNSVRQMIEAQTQSPLSVPANQGPDRLDGTTAVESLENYQAAAKKNRQAGSGTAGAAQ